MRRLVVRVFEAVVLAFACYAFVALPLGRRTGWEHMKAIGRTAPAKEAAREVPKALRQTLDRALGRTQPGPRVAARTKAHDPHADEDGAE